MATAHLVAVALAMTAAFSTTPADGQRLTTRSAPSHLIMDEHFNRLDIGSARSWGWQSAAYARCTENPDGWKYDRLTRAALSTDSGHLVITATRQSDGRWDTGLLTTGDSCDTGGSGIEVRTGDLVLVHVRLPAADSGAWPCLWTWRDGRNEMDIFEWYADRPDQIEFVNHVRSAGTVYRDDPSVGAGRWVYLGARLGADNTTWYVGPSLDRLTEAYSDHTGVGEDFAAYLILNLSISDGHWHSAPTTSGPVTLESDLLLVERPDTEPAPEAAVEAPPTKTGPVKPSAGSGPPRPTSTTGPTTQAGAGVSAVPPAASAPGPSAPPEPGCPTPPSGSARCTRAYRSSG